MSEVNDIKKKVTLINIQTYKAPTADLEIILFSGFGTAGSNNPFTEAGTHNGQKFYTTSGTNPLVDAVSWNGVSKWQQFDGAGALMYERTNASLFGDWAVGTGTGDSPAGTVRASTDVMRVVSDVTGASGDYSYRGYADLGDGQYPFFNKVGSPDNSQQHVISEGQNASAYEILGTGGGDVLVDANDFTAFPDQSSWPALTTVTKVAA